MRIPAILLQGMMTVGTVMTTIMAMMIPINMTTMTAALMTVGMIHHHSVVQGATLDVPRGKLCLTLRLSSSQRTSETDWRQNMEEIRSIDSIEWKMIKCLSKVTIL